jgi:hypothetical protein
MSRHVFISLMNAVEGKEAEYDAWYGEVHLPEVLKIPGFVAAQRFQLSTAQLRGMTPKWKYLVIYELDGESANLALAELGRRIGDGEMIVSPALAPDVTAWAYAPVELRRSADS